MKFIETPLDGAFLIDMEPYRDARGLNARLWCEREFKAHGLMSHVAQANTIINHRKGTLRGLHYQIGAAAQAKVFRCIRGAVFDVIIDLREESPTYGKWFGVELSADTYRVLYVPQRFAQGFIALTDETELMYTASALHTPECERGIRYDDPAFAIEWPMAPAVISDKDQQWPKFNALPAGAAYDDGRYRSGATSE
jgi:dTDP-4-dehydrorhamnose 3,5-epimerase